MKRVLFSAVIALLCMSCNKVSPDGYSILTGGADDISYSYATVHGSIISSDGKPVNAEFGIQYSGDSQFLSDVTNLRARNFNEEDGSFIARIIDLRASTEYWYRAYLVNKKGQCVYGDTRSFRTSALQMNVITKEASDIAFLSATLNGLYNNAGLSAEDLAGCSFFFLWGESENDLSKTAGATLLPGGAFSAEIDGLLFGTQYWFKAACRQGGKEFYGSVGSFETSGNEDYDDDYLNPMMAEAVDLGLTSGTKWCSHNLGGEGMTDIGDYYAWGDTALTMHRDVKNPNLYYYYWPYTPYWIEGESYQTAKFSKYFTPFQHVHLEAEDDAATHVMGEGWRMPTEEDWRELLAQCDWIWTTRYGNSGFIVRSKVKKWMNIFLAAGGKYTEKGCENKGESGFYWSSYASYENKIYAYGLGFNPDDLMDNLYYGYRYEGLPVRPVFPSGDAE